MTPLARAAFALACAERTQEFCALPRDDQTRATMRAALAAASAAIGEGLLAPHLAVMLAKLEGSPGLDDDAAAATAYALRCLQSGDAQEAVWSAQRAYDARDAAAQAQLQFENFTPSVEEQLRSASVVQLELQCQMEDIAALSGDSERSGEIVERARTPR